MAEDGEGESMKVRPVRKDGPTRNGCVECSLCGDDIEDYHDVIVIEKPWRVVGVLIHDFCEDKMKNRTIDEFM